MNKRLLIIASLAIAIIINCMAQPLEGGLWLF